jgi:protein-disulfide isomerase
VVVSGKTGDYGCAQVSRFWLIVTRVLLLLALTASGVLYSYYLSPLDSQFCSVRSGCDTLRHSQLAYFFGSPYLSLPLLGMVAFAGAFALSLWTVGRPSPQRHAPLCLALAVGAATAVGLVSYQVLHQAYCWLCLIVDSSSLLAALSAMMLHRVSIQQTAAQKLGVKRWAWVMLAVLATTAPLLWHVVRPLPPVHARIRALYQPDKINVVEFADLECPHCRRLQPVLKQVMEGFPGKVNFVRKHAPLPQHPHSERAAAAAICAESMAQRGEAMVERLVAVALDDQAIDTAARELGLETTAFQACLEAPATRARFEEDLALLREVGFEGLPTTYVGAQRFVGTRTEEAWRDAFDRAARNEGDSGIPGPMFLTLLLGVCALVVWNGRTAQAAQVADSLNN